MNVRKQRRLSRVVVLGLATAAVGAGSAQATAIPYLSHGQGISEEQLAQLQNTTGESSSSPSIAVGGHYLDSNLQTGNRAAPSTDVGGPATGAYGNPVGSSPAVGVTSDSPVRPDDRANHGPLNIPVEEPSSTASPGDGLNWGDFSAGVGSALGLVLVAGAAVFTLRRSRKGQLAGT
jgi:hypothetical protein